MKRVALLLLVAVFLCGALYAQGTGSGSDIAKYVWIESEHVNPAKGQTYDKVVVERG